MRNFLRMFFGLTLFGSFILTFVGIIFRHFSIGDYVFTTSLITITALFGSFFVLSVVNLSTPVTSQSKSSKKTTSPAAPFILGISTCIISYFSLYLPLTTRFIAEINMKAAKRSILLFVDKDKELRLEIDSFYTRKGSELKLKVSNNEWSETSSFSVGRKGNSNDKSNYRTALVTVIMPFPASGHYNFSFEEDQTSNIDGVRIYQGRY